MLRYYYLRLQGDGRRATPARFDSATTAATAHARRAQADGGGLLNAPGRLFAPIRLPPADRIRQVAAPGPHRPGHAARPARQRQFSSCATAGCWRATSTTCQTGAGRSHARCWGLVEESDSLDFHVAGQHVAVTVARRLRPLELLDQRFEQQALSIGAANASDPVGAVRLVSIPADLRGTGSGNLRPLLFGNTNTRCCQCHQATCWQAQQPDGAGRAAGRSAPPPKIPGDVRTFRAPAETPGGVPAPARVAACVARQIRRGFAAAAAVRRARSGRGEWWASPRPCNQAVRASRNRWPTRPPRRSARSCPRRRFRRIDKATPVLAPRRPADRPGPRCCSPRSPSIHALARARPAICWGDW